jgi:branched-chain amino acid transport system ATP-binding protein
MLLEVKNLVSSYGNIEALHGISFNVDRGEIVTLIGANGAGKTTTLLSLSRLPKPEAPTVKSGDIIFKGQSILKTQPQTLIQKKMMCLVPEGRHNSIQRVPALNNLSSINLKCCQVSENLAVDIV